MPSIEQILRLLVGVGIIAFWYGAFLLLWTRLARRRRRPFMRPVGRGRRFLRGLLRHGICLILGLGATLGLLNFYVYHGFGYQPDIYRKGDRSRPWVALTFDDGPHPDYTPRILEILKRHDVPATFFMIGAHVEEYPEIAVQIVEMGHEVGNHTWSHVNVPTTPTNTLIEEVVRTSLVIYETTGVYPEYIRPARGMYDGRFRRMSDAFGHRLVLWTLSSMDWQDGRSPQSIVKRVVDLVRPGDILLFHDSGALIGHNGGNREHTVLALEGVIQGVRNKGLQFVPLSQFLSDVEGEENAPNLAPESPP